MFLILLISLWVASLNGVTVPTLVWVLAWTAYVVNVISNFQKQARINREKRLGLR